MLKGAELCHLKKPVKLCFGGGLRDFIFDDAQCFDGIEIKSTFLSGMERAYIVRQMLFLLRAPPEGLRLSFPTDRNPVVHVQGSRSISK